MLAKLPPPPPPGLRALQGRQQLEQLVKFVKLARDNLDWGPGGPPPLLVKIAPDLTEDDKADIAAVAESARVDGLVVSNTTVTRPGEEGLGLGAAGWLGGRGKGFREDGCFGGRGIIWVWASGWMVG